MATLGAGADGQQVPLPNGAGDTGGEGRLNRRNATWAAVIGAVAVIAGALISLHPWSSGPADGSLQVGISSISYPVVGGMRAIAVTGTVRDLPAGEFVYAFAARKVDRSPWYPSNPAAVSGNGLWMAEITGLPASGGDFSVWAGVSVPSPCSGSQQCLYGLEFRRVTPRLHAEVPRS